MARMIFDLSEADRETLEAVRVSRGHRSAAEALRELVRQAGPQPEAATLLRAYAATLAAKPAITSTGHVQLGPSRQAPGSRLKAKP